LQTLVLNVGEGKPGANPRQIAEFIAEILPKYIEMTVAFLQLLRAVTKICSFRAVNDSILMWSHYASNHQGFCIEYDLEHLHSGDTLLKNLYSVIYSREVFDVDLTPWTEKLVTGKREELSTSFPLLGVIQKFEGWAYEQEWRYVFFREEPTPDQERQASPEQSSLRNKSPFLNQKRITGNLQKSEHSGLADANVQRHIRTGRRPPTCSVGRRISPPNSPGSQRVYFNLLVSVSDLWLQ
jgi:hypothetical protein